MTNAIAQTILSQLGGNQFLAMTGARQLVAGERSLTFKLPTNPKKVACIAIELDADDTYSVRVYDRKGLSTCEPREELSMIYAGELEITIGRLTGFDTRL